MTLMYTLREYLLNIGKNRSALMQIALWVAMLSVIFEHADIFITQVHYGPYYRLVIVGFMTLSLIAYIWRPVRYSALCIFAAGLILITLDTWVYQANHGWLAMWLIAPAALFHNWWDNERYLWYTRITLGIVMIAAGIQKIVTNTYIDGSYITYLSYNGSASEQLFRFMCDNAALLQPCLAHMSIGALIIVWQFLVGILLVFGFAGFWVLIIEIVFLLGAGFYADEMNFQTLNIAMLTIALRYGMPLWLLAVCIGLLIVDTIGVSKIIVFFLFGVW